MSKVFLIDISKCSGCYNCQFACKDEHCDNEWLPYAKKQPLIGQFWLKVNEHVEGTRPKVKIHYMPELCGHCANPECMKVCKDEAIKKREDGLVLIDPAKCTGCKDCVSACPYGSIYFNDFLKIAQKCTGCAHLVDTGKAPRCVSVCPTEALIYEDEEKIKNKLEGTVVLKSESGCAPKVYYKNIPGKFIAGTIYDPVEEEIIRNAKCTLTPCGESFKSGLPFEKKETSTDAFGDFWFKDLPEGKYSLIIEADGFMAKKWDCLDASCSLNIGDIPFERKH